MVSPVSTITKVHDIQTTLYNLESKIHAVEGAVGWIVAEQSGLTDLHRYVDILRRQVKEASTAVATQMFEAQEQASLNMVKAIEIVVMQGASNDD